MQWTMSDPFTRTSERWQPCFSFCYENRTNPLRTNHLALRMPHSCRVLYDRVRILTLTKSRISAESRHTSGLTAWTTRSSVFGCQFSVLIPRPEVLTENLEPRTPTGW